MGKALKGTQRQAKNLLESEQHLNRRVRVGTRPTTLWRPRLGRRLQYAFVDPHRHVASRDQACVVLRPVPDAVDPLGLTRLVFVLAHLLGQKSRIYAVPRRVNRGTASTVARKRQAAARHPDLCNNAHESVQFL
ncbi:hypothetical protein D3C72_1974730 [compost metagenome]